MIMKFHNRQSHSGPKSVHAMLIVTLSDAGGNPASARAALAVGCRAWRVMAYRDCHPHL